MADAGCLTLHFRLVPIDPGRRKWRPVPETRSFTFEYIQALLERIVRVLEVSSRCMRERRAFGNFWFRYIGVAETLLADGHLLDMLLGR